MQIQCTHAELVSRLLDDEISKQNAIFIKKHMDSCFECRDFYCFHQKVDRSIKKFLFKDGVLNIKNSKEIGFYQTLKDFL